MSDTIILSDASGAGVGAVLADVKYTQRLLGTDTLDSVKIPWQYLRSDGTLESRLSQIEAGWYCTFRGHRYIIEDPQTDNETGIEFTGRSAETELANYYTNYSPGPATYLNMLPSDIYAALLSGRVGRSVRNPGFGILDSSGLPTNWSHPSGWTSQLVSNRRVWQASAGTAESYSDDLPCTLGVSYRVTLDIKAPAGMSGNVGVKFRWIRADGSTTDSAATYLGTKDGVFHQVDTGDVVALGTRLRIVLVTSSTSQTTQFDDVRLYEVGEDTGWTADASAVDVRDASVPYNDGAIQRYGVWTEAGSPVDRIESTAVGDYVARVFNGPFVTVRFAAGGTGARAKIRVNGVVAVASLDVSAATDYTVSGLDPANDHIVEVEVAAVKVSFKGLIVSTENLISMRWDWKTVYEAIVAIREAVGGELSFDTVNRVITHATSVGQDLKAANVVEFRRGLNIVEMSRSEGRGKLVNRLTGLGYGEGEYQLAVTVDATSVDASTGKTSIQTYGVQRGTYTDKECKSLATMTATLQRMVEQSCWYRNSYTVKVTDAAAALCSPGDTGHFVYRDINEHLRILEIARSTDAAEATLQVANIEEDLTARLEATRKELATLSRSYQGVPTDANDSFSEQFERTSAGVDVPAQVGFFVPYGADIMDLRLRYQVGGMRSYAKATAGGGVLTSNSGGASTTGSGGGTTPTSSSVSTPSGGGSTSGSGGSTTPTSSSDAQDTWCTVSPSRNNTTVSTWASVTVPGMSSTYSTQWACGVVFNRNSSSCNFDYEWRRNGPSGTLVSSGSTTVNANDYVRLDYTWGSYAPGGACLRVRPTTSSPNIDHAVILTAYKAHSHTVTIPNHTHTTPNHTHTIPDHTHALTYGIYQSSVPSTVRVYLDGALVTALNDATVVSDFDLLPYIGRDSNGRVQEGWHTLEFRSATNGATGSVRGTLFARKFLSTEAA